MDSGQLRSGDLSFVGGPWSTQHSFNTTQQLAPGAQHGAAAAQHGLFSKQQFLAWAQQSRCVSATQHRLCCPQQRRFLPQQSFSVVPAARLPVNRIPRVSSDPKNSLVNINWFSNKLSERTTARTFSAVAYAHSELRRKVKV